jgi:outer membrane protein
MKRVALTCLFVPLLVLAARGRARAEIVDLPTQLSLDDALRIGRVHQPQLRQAHALTAAADARVDEARAPLLPQVTAGAAYSRRTANTAPVAGMFSCSGAAAMMGMCPTSGGTSFNTFNYFSSNITASQLLWDFGQAWRRRNAAQASADAQSDTEASTRLTTDLSIRSAFYTARAARDAVAVAREALANQNKHVEQIQAFTEVGTHPEVDLLQAKVDQANAEVQLINAENDYATGRAILNQAMGVEAPATYEVLGQPTEAIPGEAGGLDPLVDEAVRARPDLAALGAQLRAQELTNKATAARYYPALAAATGLTYNGQDLGHLVWNWSGGLSLSWAILEGGLVRATEREGAAAADAVRAQVDILREQVRIDVDAARLAIAAGKAALSASDRALVNAKARLDLAEVRYRTGVGNGIELSDAQLAATNAGFLRVQATLKLDTARAQLARALGR